MWMEQDAQDPRIYGLIVLRTTFAIWGFSQFSTFSIAMHCNGLYVSGSEIDSIAFNWILNDIGHTFDCLETYHSQLETKLF